MTQSGPENRKPRLRGVTELAAGLGAPRYRARIGRGKGRQVNLGLYDSRWLAAVAYNLAAEALHGHGRSLNEIPESEQPDADQVRRIAMRVRDRLGLNRWIERREDRPPDADRLLSLHEITVVGFWRDQLAAHGAHSSREIDLAARRLVDATHLLFWSQSSGHPTPLEALSQLLSRRLYQTYRRADLAREILEDVKDDELEISRWLVLPEDWAGAGFRASIGRVYAELLGSAAADATAAPQWAAVLRISPPFNSGQVRSAYRARSRAVHPDSGGNDEEFIFLKAAYDQAMEYCETRGL
jgi:hypothetical protein